MAAASGADDISLYSFRPFNHESEPRARLDAPRTICESFSITPKSQILTKIAKSVDDAVAYRRRARPSSTFSGRQQEDA
jgi:hypothetical protein